MKVTLRVNGTDRTVDVSRRTTLLSVLRDDLGLTGARFGCGVGKCGACYVLADGDAVASCLIPADEARGREIRTIEGIRHPIQDAFVAEDALQCGYCTSGMIVSATALLERDPGPDEATIREAMAPHLCRCGQYQRVIRAIQRAAGASA